MRMEALQAPRENMGNRIRGLGGVSLLTGTGNGQYPSPVFNVFFDMCTLTHFYALLMNVQQMKNFR